MLTELGPNLYEHTLSRPVDYGHTFSKVLEMLPPNTLAHGEAVNVDGYLCAVLSWGRGYISRETLKRVRALMKSVNLPIYSPLLTLPVALKALDDAVEHRHGEQRIPLITGIGECRVVNDVGEGELVWALGVLEEEEGS